MAADRGGSVLRSGRHGCSDVAHPLPHSPRDRRHRLDTALLIAGIALVLFVFLDALWTTLWVDGGGGPLTARLTTWAWRAVMRLVGRKHHFALSLFGPTILVAAVVFWVLLLWSGWVLIFASEPTSLLAHSEQKTPADWIGRVWFVAYAMATMGNGDFTPTGGRWQLAASLTTLSGFFLASLVISYLLSVLAAVVEKRSFAGQVTGMGSNPAEFLLNAWDGKSFRTLDLPLADMSTSLGLLTEQYLSYPILQYYHAARFEKSPAVGIAILDEALTILRYGVAESHRPSVAVLHSARATVAGYLKTLQSAFISPADDTPSAPDLSRLRAAGIPTVTDEAFAAAVAELEERRKKVRGMMLADGWNWDEWQS